MKDASRAQAIIEILDEVIKDKIPADVIIDKYFRERRYIGAKDKRFIADNVWSIIRNRMKYTDLLDGNATARLLCAYHFDIEIIHSLFNGEQYAPAKLDYREGSILVNAIEIDGYDDYVECECPMWLFDMINNEELVMSLNAPAPVDVRANLTSREAAQNRLKKEGLFFTPTPYSPIGLRSYDRINLNNCMRIHNSLACAFALAIMFLYILNL